MIIITSNLDYYVQSRGFETSRDSAIRHFTISWIEALNQCQLLTHWCRVTHICVGNLTIIGSDNGLSPERRQAIIWTNAGILLIGPMGTNFSEISVGIQSFSFKKMHFKMSSVKWCPFCPSLNALNNHISEYTFGTCRPVCSDIDVLCYLSAMTSLQ